jgi:hypothetical protein
VTESSFQEYSFGVDFSASAAYLAAVTGKKLAASIEIKVMDSPFSFRNTVRDWLLNFPQGSFFPELWIEEQFPAGRNIRAGQKLVRVQAFLEIAALDAGIEPCFVHPGTWRKLIYGNGRPDDPKERARQVAKKILGFEARHKVEHNICEGMLIGFYGHLQHHPEDTPSQAAFAAARRP